MLIEIHMIQNHAPANLNRDDLGAPKTCYFGGTIRSRISSQCLKRSIRLSDEFKALRGGIRTRQLVKLISEQVEGKAEVKKRANKVLEACGIKSKKEDKSDMLIYTTHEAIKEMAELLQNEINEDDKLLIEKFKELISTRVAVPDMALTGRMLETGKLKDTTVEASLQVAHAISTHDSRQEVDYYVAADDIPGDDAGAGFVDEAMFNSACFYKYFSIDWNQLVKNLSGFTGNVEHLAAHTVGAFLHAAAHVNPTGKQNSYAAHSLPDGVLVEIKKSTPVSFANAFVKPVKSEKRDLVEQSIAQLAQYVNDIDCGYGKPLYRFWFSPGLRYPLVLSDGTEKIELTRDNIRSLDELISKMISSIGFDWHEVQQVVINEETSA